MFISNQLYFFEQDLITEYFNKVNKETNKNFNSLFYLGKSYTSTKLASNQNHKINYITSEYLSYIEAFSQVKSILDSYNRKENFFKSCLHKIGVNSPKNIIFAQLFPTAWIKVIFESDIEGSEKYKEFLSPEEEKKFTEFVTYILGLKVIMND